MIKGLLLLMMGGIMANAASIATYTDYSEWYAAISQVPGMVIKTENFDNNQLTVPGLSFRSVSGPNQRFSGFGSIQDNQWTDMVSQPWYDQTYMTYGNGDLYGIFAHWDISQSKAGLGIWGTGANGAIQEVIPNQLLHGSFGRSYYSAFSGDWGFVSDQPFTSIMFATDLGNESFSIDNLQLGDPASSPTPEPTQTALIGVGLAGIGYLLKRGKLVPTTRS